MNGPNIMAVIPARMASHRFPGKVLTLFQGRTLLQWSVDACIQSTWIRDTLVATDSNEVHAYCIKRNIPVVYTSESHSCGTDRVVEIASSHNADVYVNVQADMVCIRPDHVDHLVRVLLSNPASPIGTMSRPVQDYDDLSDGNLVKAMVNDYSYAMWFARQVPRAFPRDRFRIHIGMYGFWRAGIERIASLPSTPVHQLDSLEQMRWLYAGMPIMVRDLASSYPYSIDTPADLEHANTMEPGRT